MAYKKRVSSRQEGVAGSDPEFGPLKFEAKAKKVSSILVALAMLVFVIAIFGSGVIDLKEDFIITALGIVFLIVGIFHISFLFDKICFYEYGMVDSTLFNLRKKRLAYDDMDSIVTSNHRFIKRNHEAVISLWRINPKKGRGKPITIDATAYVGITFIMHTIRHETKIKNIE